MVRSRQIRYDRDGLRYKIFADILVQRSVQSYDATAIEAWQDPSRLDSDRILSVLIKSKWNHSRSRRNFSRKFYGVLMRSNTGSRYGRIRFFTARIHHTEYVSSGSGQNFNEVCVEVAAGPRRDRNKVSTAQLRRSIDYNLARAGRMRQFAV